MIFGTQTTIDAGTYPRLLEQRGVAPSRIVSQACPGLADTISEDREGTKTRAELRGWVTAATEPADRNEALAACASLLPDMFAALWPIVGAIAAPVLYLVVLATLHGVLAS